MAKTFLKAEWRKIIMINYIIDPKILLPYLPYKTELDLWNGSCYVSLVGFMFLNTRIKGIKIPFHTNFEEVNLRFYVRYKYREDWKRGVVFIKEIVPKPALTIIANLIYNEHYETLPMAHTWKTTLDALFCEYSWKKQNAWNSIHVKTGTEQKEIKSGSEEEFITEHFWGFTKINEHLTSEYGVEHPRWNVYDTLDYSIHVDFGCTYGKDFKFLGDENPASIFLAEGSEIEVKEGRKI